MPAGSRRQARLDRRRQTRRRLGLLSGAALVVGVLIIVGAVIFGVRHVVAGGGKPAPLAQTQSTVLLQLESPEHTAAASVLLAADSEGKSAVEVLVPPRVLTLVCGYNSIDFGNALAVPDGETASRTALSAMLGHVTINGSWVLSPAQLAKMIDLEHGITADVDVNVLQSVLGGRSRVVVQAGSSRHLTGAQAVAYATYSTSPTADVGEQLTRLQTVLEATTRALPTTPPAIEHLLSQLGSGGASTMGAPKLAMLLDHFAAAQRTQNGLLATDLPVTAIDAGGSTPTYTVDNAGVKTLVTTQLAHSLPADANQPRPTVELLNGLYEPGLVVTACPRLTANHLAYAGSGNALSASNALSTVVVAESKLALGYQVAAALRLPRTDVERSTAGQTVADVIVTLGRDYRR